MIPSLVTSMKHQIDLMAVLITPTTKLQIEQTKKLMRELEHLQFLQSIRVLSYMRNFCSRGY